MRGQFERSSAQHVRRVQAAREAADRKAHAGHVAAASRQRVYEHKRALEQEARELEARTRAVRIEARGGASSAPHFSGPRR